MAVDIEKIKILRQKTSAGTLDCKEALEEANNDIEKAVEILRKKGITKAQKIAKREIVKEGIIDAYIHPGNKIGALIELNCETDFVAKTEEFRTLSKELCMQIVASSPIYLSKEDIPKEVLEKEKEIYREQARAENKPEKVIDKIAEGRLQKFYEEVCLLEQPFIKEEKKKVKDIIDEAMAKLGEKIVIKRFVKFKLGEE